MASLSLKFEAKIRRFVDFFLSANFFGSFFGDPKIAPFSAQIFHHLLHFHNFAFSKCFTTCCTSIAFEKSLEKVDTNGIFLLAPNLVWMTVESNVMKTKLINFQ